MDRHRILHNSVDLTVRLTEVYIMIFFVFSIHPSACQIIIGAYSNKHVESQVCCFKDAVFYAAL